MRLYFAPWLSGETHETEADPGSGSSRAGPQAEEPAGQRVRLHPDSGVMSLPDLIPSQLEKTLCALVARFRC